MKLTDIQDTIIIQLFQVGQNNRSPINKTLLNCPTNQGKMAATEAGQPVSSLGKSAEN